jgi:hypothetical protein
MLLVVGQYVRALKVVAKIIPPVEPGMPNTEPEK